MPSRRAILLKTSTVKITGPFRKVCGTLEGMRAGLLTEGLTSSLKGMGGTVGSNWNISWHSSAFMHRARLSTSLAMGPRAQGTGWDKSKHPH